MKNFLYAFYPYAKYYLTIKIQVDSRIHLNVECRWPGAHHIEPRTCLERVTYFRYVFGKTKTLRNNGVRTVSNSVNCIDVTLDY